LSPQATKKSPVAGFAAIRIVTHIVPHAGHRRLKGAYRVNQRE